MNRIFYLDPEPQNPEARPGKGPLGDAKYAFVGIAPSTNRPKGLINEPFGAASYNLLQRIKAESPSPVYVTNLVKTPLSPGKQPGVRLIREFSPGLLSELKLAMGLEGGAHPDKRILALGSVVAQLLCPAFKNLREDHGTLFWNPTLGVYVVPTFHFSAIGRDPSKLPFLSRDLKRFFSLPAPKPPQWNAVTETPRFNEGEEVVLDIESTGLSFSEDRITNIGLYFRNRAHVWVEPTVRQLTDLMIAMQSKRVTIIGHNLQFDMGFLYHKTNTYPQGCQLIDTMLMAHMLGEEILSLKHLTTMQTDRPGSRAYGGTESTEYLAEDVISTRELYDLYLPRVEKTYIFGLVHSALDAIIKMGHRGVPLEKDKLPKLLEGLTEECHTLEAQLNKEAGYELNWSSTNQVRDFLVEQKVPLRETTSAGALSVKESVLLGLKEKSPIVAKILEYREQTKLLSFVESYTGLMDEHGILHPRMLLHGTLTGRLSCREPNLQQVPRTGPMKTLFSSRFDDGLYGLIDLSQAELRVAALLSEDDKFVHALMTEDVHRTMASWVYRKPPEDVTPTERKKSKAITFGLLYGGTSKGLAERAGVPVAEVEKVLKEFYSLLPKLMGYLERTGNQGIKNQWISTPFGRERSLKTLLLMEGPKSVKRKAVNTPIQGTASDIMLKILVYVSDELERRGFRSAPLFGVHDSTLLEIVDPELADVVKVVQEGFESLWDTPLTQFALWKDLPIVGELVVGGSWAEVESTNEEHYNPQSKFPCSSHPTDHIPQREESGWEDMVDDGWESERAHEKEEDEEQPTFGGDAWE